MTRDAFADRLLDLAYGELSPREAREVEAHAASCEACRAELGRLRETRRLMAALPPEEPSPDGERVLIAAARQAAEGRPPRRALAPWRWGALAAACALLAVGAVSWRILAMRPGPLDPAGDDALLGRGPYAAAPAQAPAAPEETRGAAGTSAAPEASRRSGEPETRPFAKAPPRAAPAAPVAPERRSRAAAPEAGATAKAAPSRDDAPPAAPAEPRGRREEAEERAPERMAGAPGELRDEGSPPPSAAAAPAPTAASPRGKRAAAPRAAASAAPGEAAVPGTEVRTFAGCEGETLRRVERDAEGRLVRYVREGRIGGRRVRIEHVYGADGALARATARDLDGAGAPLDPAGLGVLLPARAEEAGIDAPPRCGR
jgi:hypothetical protein